MTSFSHFDHVQVEVDVNLMLLGFDRFNSDFSSIQNGILEKLSSHKIQRFLEVKGHNIQEKDGSHIDYLIHYHFIQVNPLVEVYLRHVMESVYRDVDMNLMNVKVINPYEIVRELRNLFDYVSQNSNQPVPNDQDLIILVLNSQVDVGGTFGFSTEFSYTEMQKMIDEIFREGSDFAISDFVFPLTEPLTFSDEFETPEDDSSLDEGLHPIPAAHSVSSDYCVFDWRELSFMWAYKRDSLLKENLASQRSRSSIARIRRSLELLQHAYNKNEQKRLLVEMKQVLNNDIVMNDELVNMIEGTHVVSDYIFIDQFFILDVCAGPFEWGSIHDESNIRTKESLLFAGNYSSSLRYFNTTQEVFVNYAQFIHHRVTRACAREHNSQCSVDEEQVKSILQIFQFGSNMNVGDYSRYYHSLLMLEKAYPPTDPTSLDSRLSVEEMEVTIRLSRILSDVISHFVTPPFVLSPPAPESSLFSRSIPAPVTNTPTTVEGLLSSLSHIVTRFPSTKEKLHFQVNYFTRADFEDLFTVDENYFDYSVFRNEVERLKLPSQEFYFSFQELKLENEPHLQSALLQATTSVIIPHLSYRRTIFPVQQSYVNSSVLFDILRSKNHAMTSKDIQIYIFCMTGTSKRPLLFDKSELVVYHSDGQNQMIFAIQNELMSTNSPYFVNELPMHYNLHDIMAPLLSCVFELLSNTRLNLYFGEQIHTRIAPLTEDCIYRSIGSVDRVFSVNHVYSSFHLDIMRKSKLIVMLQLLISDYNDVIVLMIPLN